MTATIIQFPLNRRRPLPARADLVRRVLQRAEDKRNSRQPR